MTGFDIATKISHRFLYGYLHHSQMASFFDLLKMPITADNQRKNAFEDAKKRQKMDEYIIFTYDKIPLYTVSNIETVAKELINATYESIKANKNLWLKKGIEALIRYEKETLALFETFKKEAEEAKDSKLVEGLKKYIEDVQEELKIIEHFQKELEKHGYDYEKFKQEKGDKDMPRRYYRDDRYYDDDRYDDRYDDEHERKRRRETMDDDRYDDDDYDRRRRRVMDDDRYPMDDDRYEPMGFADRKPRYDDDFYPYIPYMDREMEMRRGVPGTGRGRRRRRYYR